MSLKSATTLIVGFVIATVVYIGWSRQQIVESEPLPQVAGLPTGVELWRIPPVVWGEDVYIPPPPYTATPVPTPTVSETPTPESTQSSSVVITTTTPSPTPSLTPSVTPTPYITRTPTSTPSATPSYTPEPSRTPTPTYTPSLTPTPPLPTGSLYDGVRISAAGERFAGFVPSSNHRRVEEIDLLIVKRVGAIANSFIMIFEIRQLDGTLQHSVSAPLDLKNLPTHEWISVKLSANANNLMIEPGEYLVAHTLGTSSGYVEVVIEARVSDPAVFMPVIEKDE